MIGEKIFNEKWATLVTMLDDASSMSEQHELKCMLNIMFDS